MLTNVLLYSLVIANQYPPSHSSLFTPLAAVILEPQSPQRTTSLLAT